MKVTALCDGACRRANPGDASIGVSMYSEGKNVLRMAKRIGIKTSNEAEYASVIHCMERAITLGYDEIEITMDSQLAVYQISGQWKIKNPRMRKLCEKINELKRHFKSFNIQWKSRDNLQEVDDLANQALDLDMEMLKADWLKDGE